jgi:hypothetical protein
MDNKCVGPPRNEAHSSNKSHILSTPDVSFVRPFWSQSNPRTSSVSPLGPIFLLYLPDPVYQCLLENLKYERTIETSSLPKKASYCEMENTGRTTKGGDGRIQRIQYRTSGPISNQVTFNLLDQLLAITFL